MTPTREQAIEALKVVTAYLAHQAKLDEGNIHEALNDPQHWKDAAEWATEILDASERDNWRGCQLCRS
jgi:hypothetical protein